MYQSSSESSIELGNFPSVIDLYEDEQKDRNGFQGNLKTAVQSNNITGMVNSSDIPLDTDNLSRYQHHHHHHHQKSTYMSSDVKSNACE